MLAATALVVAITVIGTSGAFAFVDVSALLGGDEASSGVTLILGVWIGGGLLALLAGGIAVGFSVHRLRRQPAC